MGWAPRPFQTAGAWRPMVAPRAGWRVPGGCIGDLGRQWASLPRLARGEILGGSFRCRAGNVGWDGGPALTASPHAGHWRLCRSARPFVGCMGRQRATLLSRFRKGCQRPDPPGETVQKQSEQCRPGTSPRHPRNHVVVSRLEGLRKPFEAPLRPEETPCSQTEQSTNANGVSRLSGHVRQVNGEPVHRR